ncbi:Mitochondrial ribonuclease P protein 3 [Trichoplax sp. H2]|nr:Mitochondrial ribonuclease P protein 3 [Trichoplax sp. H2]|eukprot:RDD47488.1 Mitochondrial ribonuclease P protein 3 [Trichoplax sp. H2]
MNARGLYYLNYATRRYSILRSSPSLYPQRIIATTSQFIHLWSHRYDHHLLIFDQNINKKSKQNFTIDCLKLHRKKWKIPYDPDDDTKPHYYRKRMAWCCKQDTINEAIELMDQSINQSVTLDIGTFNSYLYLVIRYNLFDKMIQCEKKIRLQDVAFDATTYSTLASGYSKMNNWVTALNLLREMQSKGIYGKARNYSPLISAAALDNQHQLVFDLLNEIKNPDKLYLFPDDNIYCDIIEMCARSQDSTEIFKLAQHIYEIFRREGLRIGSHLKPSILKWFRSHPTSNWEIRHTAITHSGYCKSCKAQLESIELTSDRQERLREVISQSISSGEIFKKYKGDSNAIMSDYSGKIAYGSPDQKVLVKHSQDPFKDFCQWLHPTRKVDIVIDGLNIAHGRDSFDPLKILKVIRHYRALGKEILLIARIHLLKESNKSTKYKAMIDSIFSSCRVFLCPNNHSDDVYFLYAAVHGGMNVKLISDDQFRDFKKGFSLTLLKDFLQWLRGHQVRVERFRKGKKLILTARDDLTLYEPLLDVEYDPETILLAPTPGVIISTAVLATLEGIAVLATVVRVVEIVEVVAFIVVAN